MTLKRSVSLNQCQPRERDDGPVALLGSRPFVDLLVDEVGAGVPRRAQQVKDLRRGVVLRLGSMTAGSPVARVMVTGERSSMTLSVNDLRF